jgi:hypothetical protein
MQNTPNEQNATAPVLKAIRRFDKLHVQTDEQHHYEDSTKVAEVTPARGQFKLITNLPGPKLSEQKPVVSFDFAKNMLD